MPSGVTCVDELALFVAEFAGTDELLRDMLTAPVAIAVLTAPVARRNLGCTGRIS